MTPAARAISLARGRWGLLAVGAAFVAVAIAAVVAWRGLAADPVGSTDSAGVTTLRGTFFPYECGHGGGCRGYVQAGGRSVFVVLPRACPDPVAGSDVTVRGRRAPDLGRASYVAVACASAG